MTSREDGGLKPLIHEIDKLIYGIEQGVPHFETQHFFSRDMERPHPREVERWIEAMKDEEPNIRMWGLDIVYQLPRIPIDGAFLKAAIQFWDPDVHTFRFGDNEICPTVEEFGAILGLKHKPVVIPTFRPNYKEMLREGCQLLSRDMNIYMREGRMDTRALCQKFASCGEDTPRNARRFAFGICLLDQYFFVSKEAPDAGLVDVVHQLAQGKDPSVMILAETMMALDDVQFGRSKIFGGSPHLLKLWLEEKLGLLTVPLRSPYRPNHILQRHPILPFKTTASWIWWLSTITHHTIRWTSPWWDIGDMTTLLSGKKGLVIFGLRHTTKYFPYRVMRQFGDHQVINYKKGLMAETAPTTQHFLEEQGWNKQTRVRQIILKEPKQLYLDKEYREWLHDDISKRNEAKKKKNQEEARRKALDELRRRMRKPPSYPPPTHSMP